jgi:hypothetical protein
VTRVHDLLDALEAIEDHAAAVRTMIEEWGLAEQVPRVVRGIATSVEGLASSCQRLVRHEEARFPDDGARRGGFIVTHSQRRVWPFDLRPGDVVPEDIVVGLVRTPRFRGQTARSYTVAEHTLLVVEIVSRLAPEPLLPLARAYAALHDAAEAYTCDMPRPIAARLHGWRRLQERVFQVVLEAFELGPPPAEVDDLVRRADDLALVLEAESLFPSLSLFEGGLPHVVRPPGVELPEIPTRVPQEAELYSLLKIELAAIKTVGPPAVTDSAEHWTDHVAVYTGGGACRVCGAADASRVTSLCASCEGGA